MNAFVNFPCRWMPRSTSCNSSKSPSSVMASSTATKAPTRTTQNSNAQVRLFRCVLFLFLNTFRFPQQFYSNVLFWTFSVSLSASRVIKNSGLNELIMGSKSQFTDQVVGNGCSRSHESYINLKTFEEIIRAKIHSLGNLKVKSHDSTCYGYYWKANQSHQINTP